MAEIDITKATVNYLKLIAAQLKVKDEQVANTHELLQNGATVPFMARYRKEKTGSLNEEQLRSIEELVEYYKELEARKVSVLRRIEAQKKLTPELKKLIDEATQKVQVEDLYLPYKFKKKNRASAAKEAGLEPLARVFQQMEPGDAEELAKAYISKEKGVKTVQDAIKGALDILAEEVAETAVWKEHIRKSEKEKSFLTSTVKKKFEGKPSKFEMYYEFKEKVSALPSHRILALRRGEKEGYITTTVVMDDEHNIDYLKNKVIQPC